MIKIITQFIIFFILNFFLCLPLCIIHALYVVLKGFIKIISSNFEFFYYQYNYR